jgi:hypothetical protein
MFGSERRHTGHSILISIHRCVCVCVCVCVEYFNVSIAAGRKAGEREVFQSMFAGIHVHHCALHFNLHRTLESCMFVRVLNI